MNASLYHFEAVVAGKNLVIDLPAVLFCCSSADLQHFHMGPDLTFPDFGAVRILLAVHLCFNLIFYIAAHLFPVTYRVLSLLYFSTLT